MTEFASQPDKDPVYECGIWTIEKLFFLSNYLAQFTQAMIGHPRFSEFIYVDMFSGSGICQVSEGGRTRRYPGSSLLAAGCEKSFSKLLYIDDNSENIKALETRIERLGTASAAFFLNRDVNTVIEVLRGYIPPNSLSVVFIDPYSLQISFESIRELTSSRRMDLIILFADRMDIGRNVEKYYYDNTSSKLDAFLGSDADWRPEWDALQNREGLKVCELFADIYLRQLEKIGFVHSRKKIISGPQGPLYRLIYASRHEFGLKIWDIALNYELGGDKGLFGV
ncbi:MAG: three-Cys-motif partner protein TcmP [Planctomycetes bacterium]|nr:three-Cys-motif partner protein TcmP [Planctomycetota bacterium]